MHVESLIYKWQLGNMFIAIIDYATCTCEESSTKYVIKMEFVFNLIICQQYFVKEIKNELFIRYTLFSIFNNVSIILGFL
jgi:hypothetical protein